MKGGSGTDQLWGGDGDDIIYGQDGLDTMCGGSGADKFVFEGASATNNIDVVKDFVTGQGDIIDVHDVLIGYSGTVTDFVRFTDDSGNTKVEVDRDGTGGTYSFTRIATLTGVTGLTDEAALVSSGNLLVT